MSDISLMGYNYRIDELRAEAEQQRLIREVRQARRAANPRPTLVQRLRTLVIGARTAPVDPREPDSAPALEPESVTPTGPVATSEPAAEDDPTATVPVGTRA